MTGSPTSSASKAGLFAQAQVLARNGRWQDAIDLWRQIIRLDDQDPRAHANLGLTLAKAGLSAEAVDAYGEAFRLGHPEDEVLAGLGFIFCLREQYGIARENLERATALNPDNLTAWSHLVVACARLGLVELAVHAAEHVLRVRPKDTATLSALGTMCKDAGMPNEALAWFQRAIDADPDNVQDFSNLLWAMLHSDAVTPEEIVIQARRYDARACKGLAAQEFPGAAIRGSTPGILRIGWVSGDMRSHPVGHFVIPVLEQLDRARFESIIYSNSHVADEMSLRAKKATSGWRDIASLGDDQVADLIRSDRIDLLIDLSGHTAGNRLPVFARRAAPIQATWLGCPGTSGLRAMDYILVPPDPALLSGAWCTETPVALPDCYCVLDPGQIKLSAAAPPHELTDCTTFGCLNNFTKVSPSAISAWARIMEEVSGSRLVLVATGGGDQSLVADIQSRFASLGIAHERLTIHGRMDYETYLATYHDLDIALDPFPFNGGTTGVDSLYMGTPYITLQGQALHSRLGSNLLRPLGLQELTATSPDDYVRLAVSLAHDRGRLKEIRGNLRKNMENSALMDVSRFAHGMEQVFLEMCSRDPRTSVSR